MHSKHIRLPRLSVFYYFPIVSSDCFVSKFITYLQESRFYKWQNPCNVCFSETHLIFLSILLHFNPFSYRWHNFFLLYGWGKCPFWIYTSIFFFKKIEFYVWVLFLHHFQPSLSNQLLPCTLKSMASSLLLHTTHTHTPRTINLLNLFGLACMCTYLSLTAWN